MRYYPFLLFLVLLISLGSCSSSKKTVSAPPAAPPTQHLSLTAQSMPDALLSLPPSEIDLPVKIAGKPLLRAADSLLPKEFISDKWPGYIQPSCDFRYKYRFVRGGFNVECINNKVTIHLDGNYQVAGGKSLCVADRPVSPWINGQCGFGGETMRRVNLTFSSQLSFLPDYRLRTNSGVEQVVAMDKCTMSMFSVDMTQLIADSIKSSILSFCHAFDDVVKKMNVSSYLHQTSALIGQKISMGGYGYLMVNPASIRIGALNYARDTFSISFGISCHPELSSDSTQLPHPKPLPALASGPSRSGITLYLPARYEYGFISKMINDSVRNRSFEFKGRTVIINNVAIKGIGHHQVQIRVDFSGSKSGSVLLWGTPVLDTAKQALDVPDITFSLESKDLMLKMARAIFRNKIKNTLRGTSYLDLAALLKAHMPSINAQLNRAIIPTLKAQGEVKELKLIGLLVKENAIEAQVLVKADLSLVNTGLPKY